MTRSALAGVAMLGIAALTACAGTAVDAGARPTTPSPRLVWSDEFDGAAGARASADRWTYEQGGAGWGNDELQCYTDSTANAATNGSGELVIVARQAPGHSCPGGTTNGYTSARLSTKGRFAAGFGRLEMRAKMPSGVGTWPAFWSMGADLDAVGWPRAGEIDVVEYLPREPSQSSGTLHGPTTTGAHWQINRTVEAGIDLNHAFHEYAAEWTPDAVRFFLDGELFGTVTRRQATEVGRWKADHPHFLLVNLAVGGTLGGDVPPTTTWPQRFVIDYVRVFAPR